MSMSLPDLKLYGRADSINVQKVLWVLAEIDWQVPRQDVGGAYGFPDGFADLNPFVNVPVLTLTWDGARDSKAIMESNSIMRLLADLSDRHDLYPSESVLRTTVDGWLDVQLSRVEPPMRTLFLSLVRGVPPHGDPSVVLSQAVVSVEVVWSALEKIFERLEYPFIVGENPTIADIALGLFWRRWLALPDIDRTTRPHLDAWWRALEGTAGYGRAKLT